MLSACAPNVVLRRSPASASGALGPFQRCVRGEKPCEVDQTFDTSRFNQFNTTFFSLPKCPYGIDRILIEKVGTSNTVVSAQCAAPPPFPGLGIPTAGDGGGTSPTPQPPGP